MTTLSRIRTFVAVLTVAALLGCAGQDSSINPDDVDSIPPINTADTIPPSVTQGLNVTLLPGNDQIRIEWTAPFDNEPDEKVDRYEIRYAFTRGFVPPNFWDLSTPLQNLPAPEEPGTTENYMFGNVEIGKDFYVGIRSFDADGNRSPPSALATVHVPGLTFSGQCVNLMTGLPVPNLSVRITAGVVRDLTTNLDGQFSQQDVFPGAVNITIETGTAAGSFHKLNQLFIADGDSVHSFGMIPYIPTVVPEAGGISVLSLLKLLTGTGSTTTILYQWKNTPVPLYFKPYVNGNAVDYEAEVTAAAERWMIRTGAPLFTFVSSPPDTGIIVNYRRSADIAPLVAVTTRTVGADNHPLRDVIDIVDDFTNSNNAYKVFMHELGHTIRFMHMSDRAFIMYGGQPLPQDITDDEANAARLHHALPPRIDMAIYDDSIP
jgi:hypothetical protein